MKFAPLAALAILAGTSASANEFEPQIREYLSKNVMIWANDPVLIAAVAAQNSANAGIGQDRIDSLDQAWRAEVGAAETPTITPVLRNPASDFLRGKVAASAGAIVEVFVMDRNGLNVAASDVTSDYWQGDEAKFTESFGSGGDAVFIDEVEFDESTQSYLAQVSFTITDPVTRQPIGAMTIGLNAEQLF